MPGKGLQCGHSPKAVEKEFYRIVAAPSPLDTDESIPRRVVWAISGKEKTRIR
jgi:hypothetical protein